MIGLDGLFLLLSGNNHHTMDVDARTSLGETLVDSILYLEKIKYSAALRGRSSKKYYLHIWKELFDSLRLLRIIK
jgi:hypothetical protein